MAAIETNAQVLPRAVEASGGTRVRRPSVEEASEHTLKVHAIMVEARGGSLILRPSCVETPYFENPVF